MRESYITQYPLIRPRPLTSRHSRWSADRHAAQVSCGGYCRRLHAVQFCTIRRRSLHASQNGLLTSSGTGIGFGTVHSSYCTSHSWTFNVSPLPPLRVTTFLMRLVVTVSSTS